MATLPNVALFTPGEKPASAKMNSIRDGINFFLNKPTALAFNAAIAVGSGGSGTYMTFSQERYDNDNIHSTTSLTSRLVCVTPGVYAITANLLYPVSAGGTFRNIAVRLNGTTMLRDQHFSPVSFSLSVAFEYKLVLNDFLELRAFHDIGAAVNVTPEFGMTWQSVG